MVLVLALVVGIGAWVYQVGFAGGLASAAASGGAIAPYAGPYGWHGYGWHPFFFPFGFLGGLLVLFLVFGLLRAAFWGGRRRHWGSYGGPGGGNWQAQREQHMREIHDEWHRQSGQSGQPPAQS